MTDKEKPYVGYKNPPEYTQFKKGKSGNPRGRPRRKDDLNTILMRVLQRKFHTKDLDRKMPIREALIRKLKELALRGDKQALALQKRILIEAGHDEPDLELERQQMQRTIESVKKHIGQLKLNARNDDEG